MLLDSLPLGRSARPSPMGASAEGSGSTERGLLKGVDAIELLVHRQSGGRICRFGSGWSICGTAAAAAYQMAIPVLATGGRTGASALVCRCERAGPWRTGWPRIRVSWCVPGIHGRVTPSASDCEGACGPRCGRGAGGGVDEPHGCGGEK